MDRAPTHRVIVADDDPRWCARVEELLAVAGSCTVVRHGQADRLERAIALARPEAVVVSYRLDGLDLFGLARQVLGSPEPQRPALYAVVAADDATGDSVARLTGCDRVFRQVIDDRRLQACLLRRLADGAGDPVFDPERAGQRRSRQDFAGLAWEFLDRLPANALILRVAAHQPRGCRAQLRELAAECRVVGAAAAARHLDLMAAVAADGRILSEGDFHRLDHLLEQTTRAITGWLIRHQRVDRGAAH